ncbi:hypothetical protein DSO57_1001672 [Entomophthora muscae]|uniref:Uncharacterized protein n=1 Tax=Entomophthora muscae TaxID=34485 RepID=A0ACC2TWR3_9FUNG|nr:hypothetical protein DSO57_1001672 [Entomophthora muscae]
MYLVRGNDDPQVTVIPESLILLDSGSPLPQTPPTAPAVSPQLLVIAPAPSSELAPPLALLGMLLHNILVAQHSSLDGQAICAKLSPDSASNDPYTLKDMIIYQNNKVWVPKELLVHFMTEHHDPPLFGHPGTKKLLELIRHTYSWAGITKAVVHGSRSVSPALAPNWIVQGITAYFTPCSSPRARGHPSQLTLWCLSPCWEVLAPLWW